MRSANAIANNASGYSNPFCDAKNEPQCTPKIAIAITKAREKAPSRVSNPRTINAPPTNSEIAAAPIQSHAGRIQQLPGAKNALGELKLELPNRFSVYLHDTPGRGAFAGDRRALSHGCIRVQQVLPLAVLALGGDAGETMGRLNTAIGGGTTQKIELNNPLPIYVLYWTAMAGDNGMVEFRRDLYGRDRRLNAVLADRLPLSRLALYTGDCEVLPD